MERIIDRKRGMSCNSSDGALATCVATAGGAFVDAQCSIASFDIHQPLVSTRLLNGSALDDTTAENDVEAIAASWNKSRFASRVGLETPVAWCAFYSHAVLKFSRSFLNDIFCVFFRRPMRENWTHDDFCLACGDGGELLMCNLCPAAYHLECIGAKKV